MQELRIKPEYSKTYCGPDLILFQNLKRCLSSILLQLLAFFNEVLDSTTEAVAVLGAAVRKVREDTKGTFTTAARQGRCFRMHQGRCTAQSAPYVFSTTPIFFQLFCRLLGVPCKLTISLAISRSNPCEIASLPFSLLAEAVPKCFLAFLYSEMLRVAETPNPISC